MSVASLSSGTHVFDHHLRAVLTLDRAAPLELTVTAADYLCPPLLYPQATLMAQSAAAPLLPLVQALALLQALPALSTVKAQAGVLTTVVRRFLQVNELRSGDAAERVRNGAPVVGAVPRPHPPLVHFQFLRLVVFDFEVVADVSEVRQLHPAGLNGTAPGDAVALTDSLHGRLDRLERASVSYGFNNISTVHL